MLIVEDILWLLVLIGVMILIHELGHFWAARFFDVKVEVFSFGFGPRLFGFRRGDTDYRFSLILFGGYVKMAGEQPNEQPQAGETEPSGRSVGSTSGGPVLTSQQSVETESRIPEIGANDQIYLWQKPRWQ